MKVPEPRKLKSGNWFIQLRLNGESLPITASTAKECINRATLIKAEYKAGKRIQSQSIDNITLRQAINNYIDARSNTLSPATIRGYKIIRDNRFKSLMDKKIKDIKDWQSACNKEAKNCSPKTLKNSWYLVASVLKETTGEMVPNVSLPQVVPNEHPFLDPDQISLFVEAVHNTKVEIPALLALSSLRCSEICALTWDNIDLKNRRILVSGAVVYGPDNKLTHKETNKNNSSRRYVPIMMDELFDALSTCENKTGEVVKQRPNTIFRQINKVCEENDLPNVGVHGLRHSFASLAYHLGMPEKMAMQIGGWSDRETMSKIYTHLAQKDVSKFENQMTEFYKKSKKQKSEG